MATTMATQTQTGSNRPADAEQKIQKLRELFADAPEVGKTALEKAVTDGIEVSPDDQIIAARRGAYLVSLAERTGGWQHRGTLTAAPPIPVATMAAKE